MNDERKSKEKIISEFKELRKQVFELEMSESTEQKPSPQSNGCAIS